MIIRSVLLPIVAALPVLKPRDDDDNDPVTAYIQPVVAVAEATTTVPPAVVYVDANGNQVGDVSGAISIDDSRFGTSVYTTNAPPMVTGDDNALDFDGGDNNHPPPADTQPPSTQPAPPQSTQQQPPPQPNPASPTTQVNDDSETGQPQDIHVVETVNFGPSNMVTLGVTTENNAPPQAQETPGQATSADSPPQGQNQQTTDNAPQPTTQPTTQQEAPQPTTQGDQNQDNQGDQNQGNQDNQNQGDQNQGNQDNQNQGDNQGNDNQGDQGNQGDNQGNQGDNQGNQGNQGDNQGNQGNQGDNQGNNQGNDQGNQGDNQGNDQGNQNQQTSTQVPPPPTTSSTESPQPTQGQDGSLTPPTYIVYSPYNNDQSCKDADTVRNDLAIVKQKGINKVRIYGSDCGAFTNILPACKDLGLKVNQGFWFAPGQGPDSIDGGVSEFVSWGQSNGWDIIDFVTVGNEAINDGNLSPGQLNSKLSSVRGQLQAAGYSGSVITSEPPISFINHPELCEQSDFIGTNIHSYFNTGVNAAGAGEYLKQQNEAVAQACPGKKIYVTETGYPHKGNTNGLNVPTKENQKIVFESIWNTIGNDVTVLAMWDDYWKNPGPYNIEQFFGALDLFS